MCWFVPLAIGAVTAVAGAAQQRKAVDAETEAAVNAANFNTAEAERSARLSEGQAADAYGRGETERLRYMRDFQQQQGTRAAALGASGIDVNSGSALDILADSAAVAALDAKTIRHNAAQEAKGYLEQARNTRVNAAMGRNEARYAIQAGEMKKDAITINAIGSIAGMAGGAMAGGMGGAMGGAMAKKNVVSGFGSMAGGAMASVGGRY